MLLPTVSTEKGTSKKEYLSVHIVGSLVQEFYAATEMMLGHNGMKNKHSTPFNNKSDLDRES